MSLFDINTGIYKTANIGRMIGETDQSSYIGQDSKGRILFEYR